MMVWLVVWCCAVAVYSVTQYYSRVFIANLRMSNVRWASISKPLYNIQTTSAMHFNYIFVFCVSRYDMRSSVWNIAIGFVLLYIRYTYFVVFRPRLNHIFEQVPCSASVSRFLVHTIIIYGCRYMSVIGLSSR